MCAWAELFLNELFTLSIRNDRVGDSQRKATQLAVAARGDR
jgi:hypothetical protein